MSPATMCDLRARDRVDELVAAQARGGRGVAERAAPPLGSGPRKRRDDFALQRLALPLLAVMQQRHAARQVIEDQQRLRRDVAGFRHAVAVAGTAGSDSK